jgi:hypothetical protein
MNDHERHVMTEQPAEQKPEKKPGLGTIILSTLSAFIGIQSSKNRERDFAKGNFKSYVVSGIIFTVLFILVISTLAKFAIKQAGG